jgi:hypothetical protein
MSLRFYIGYVIVLLAVVLSVEAALGTLYARYVIIYTGAIFLVGLIVGRRYEQSWLAHQGRRGIPPADGLRRPSAQPSEADPQMGGAAS